MCLALFVDICCRRRNELGMRLSLCVLWDPLCPLGPAQHQHWVLSPSFLASEELRVASRHNSKESSQLMKARLLSCQ